jgi:hypothetical protein
MRHEESCDGRSGYNLGRGYAWIESGASTTWARVFFARLSHPTPRRPQSHMSLVMHARLDEHILSS